MFLYGIVRLLLAPLVRLVYSVKIEGRENIPRHGGVILASNHPDLRDPLLVGLACRRPVTFGAKSEFFAWRGVGWVTKPIFTALQQMPVCRSGGRKAQAFVEAAIRHVGERQQVLGIFPEGWLSPAGQLHRMRRGVARIALATEAPVVLIAISYGDRSWRTLGRRRISLKLAPRVSFTSEAAVSDVMADIEGGLQKLTGLPGSGIYAAALSKG
jgi:1-acyl-sn-glycerol-3-phosphate acyltransferase